MPEEKPREGYRKDSSNSDAPLIGDLKPYYADGLISDNFHSTMKSVNNDSDEDLIGAEEPSKNSSRVWNILSSMVIEALMFAFMFSYMMRNMITTNMIMDKACQFRLNYSQEICSNLSSYEDEKAEVEKIANNYSLYINLIHMGPAALVMIFLGSWSDKYGRKPPLMLTIVGTLIEDVGSVLNAYYFDAKLEYMLLSPVSSGITGGFICFLTVMFSLVSEVTTKERRTIKYAFVELALGLGMTCGSLAGGLIYKFANSYSAVYCVSAAGHVICGIWVIIVITETRVANADASWKQKICDAFTFERVIEGFKVCMKVRENYGRAQIWMLFGSMCAIVVTYESFAGIGYTYVHHVFNWDPSMYSYVTSVCIGIGLVIMVICVPLFKRVLKLNDPQLGIIGTLSAMAKNIFIGLALKPWIYFMGSAIGVLFALATLSVRSILSKLVPEDDLGKVFALLSTCEALVPLAGTVVITKIFNDTLGYFPGMCYLIASALMIVPLGVFIWISKLKPDEHEIMKLKEDDSQPVSVKNC